MKSLQGLEVGMFFLFWCHGIHVTEACQTGEWRNMSMAEILFRSDVVLYGKDIDHGKFRYPTELDARFDVHCVIKAPNAQIPGQIIIEDILNDEECIGTYEQTKENNMYIVGLTRLMSGFMAYANVNQMQRSAFPTTKENLDILAATCSLDNWAPPLTGDQNLCPTPNKPRFCTKVRVATDGAEKCSSFARYNLLILVLTVRNVFFFS